MNNLPKVSIIIPCYNQSEYVGEAIESALKQTYENLEIVCINDASTDNSSEVIKSYAEKYKNIVFLDEKTNRGVINARNTAIAASSGEYILPLDADDKIESQYVEKAARVLYNNPNVGIVYCKADFFGRKNRLWKLEEFDRKKIIFENQIFNSSLFRKKDFNEIGGYKDYMKYGCEDWDLWLSFVEKGFEVYRINEVLFHYRKLKEKTRSDAAYSYTNIIISEIFNNHINLFLENDEFYERVFHDFALFQRKHEKYKKLFNNLLIALIVETIVVLVVILSNFLYIFHQSVH